MSDGNTGTVLETIQWIKVLLAQARGYLSSEPEERAEQDRRLTVFTDLIVDMTNLFIPLADDHITPLCVSAAPLNVGRDTHLETFNWIAYCKSWSASVRLLADQGVFEMVSHRNDKGQQDNHGVNDGLSNLSSLRSTIGSIERSEMTHCLFRSREEMNSRWKTQPPSASSLLINAEQHQQAWSVTEVAIDLVDILYIYYSTVKTYCEDEDRRIELAQPAVNSTDSSDDAEWEPE